MHSQTALASSRADYTAFRTTRPDRAVLDSFLKKLNHYNALTAQENKAVIDAFTVSKTVLCMEDFGGINPRTTALRVIQSGFACQYISFADGRRQSVKLLIPGDVCDMPGADELDLNYEIRAITKVTFATIAPDTLQALTRTHPNVASALAKSARADQAMLFERVATLARLARERLAHLLYEAFLRCQLAGLTVGMQCSFPINQRELGDLLGLSIVHTNRSLQALRADGLVDMCDKKLTIMDIKRLREAGMSSYSYLQ